MERHADSRQGIEGIAAVENHVGGEGTSARHGHVLHGWAARCVYVGTEREMEALLNSFGGGKLQLRSRDCFT